MHAEHFTVTLLRIGSPLSARSFDRRCLCIYTQRLGSKLGSIVLSGLYTGQPDRKERGGSRAGGDSLLWWRGQSALTTGRTSPMNTCSKPEESSLTWRLYGANQRSYKKSCARIAGGKPQQSASVGHTRDTAEVYPWSHLQITLLFRYLAFCDEVLVQVIDWRCLKHRIQEGHLHPYFKQHMHAVLCVYVQHATADQ